MSGPGPRHWPPPTRPRCSRSSLDAPHTLRGARLPCPRTRSRGRSLPRLVAASRSRVSFANADEGRAIVRGARSAVPRRGVKKAEEDDGDENGGNRRRDAWVAVNDALFFSGGIGFGHPRGCTSLARAIQPAPCERSGPATEYCKDIENLHKTDGGPGVRPMWIHGPPRRAHLVDSCGATPHGGLRARGTRSKATGCYAGQMPKPLAKASILVALVGLVLSSGRDARADVLPPRASGCSGKAADAPCSTDNGVSGKCASVKCGATVPSNCLVCDAVGSADGGVSDAGMPDGETARSCSAGPHGPSDALPFIIGIAALALASRRRRG